MAADPTVIIAARNDDFVNGLNVLSNLTDGKLFVTKAPGTTVNTGNAKVDTHEFSGPHPAGLVGTHIHMLDPVGPSKKYGISTTKTSLLLVHCSLPVRSITRVSLLLVVL